MLRPLMRPGLYAIVDVDAFRATGVELADAGAIERVIDALLAAEVSVVQLRCKREDARVALALLRRIVPRTREARVPCCANDRADLALLAGTDLVHVGQDDLAIEDVRKVAPSIGVGLSTHDHAQLAAALLEKPAYVAFGPVFGTKSKARPDPTVGLAWLKEASEMAARAETPLVAIGGITVENAAEVVAHGAHTLAVIGAITARDPADVRARAGALIVATQAAR